MCSFYCFPLLLFPRARALCVMVWCGPARARSLFPNKPRAVCVHTLPTRKSLSLCFSLNARVSSFGQLKPEVLAGSLTAGNYVNFGSLHAGCSYADSGLRDQDEAVEICERHVTSQQLIAHSCVLTAEDTFCPYLMFGSAIFPKVPGYGIRVHKSF